jgi:hypothetical protein
MMEKDVYTEFRRVNLLETDSAKTEEITGYQYSEYWEQRLQEVDGTEASSSVCVVNPSDSTTREFVLQQILRNIIDGR